MKAGRLMLSILLFVFICSILIYEIIRELPSAFEYYKINRWLLPVIILASSVLGLVLLVYQEKVSDKKKALHSFILTTILALGFAIFAILSSVTVLRSRYVFAGLDKTTHILYMMLPLPLYLLSGVLFWRAMVIRKNIR